MAVSLQIDVVFPTVYGKKSKQLMLRRLTETKAINKINPLKLTRITDEGEIIMELIDGLKVTCHTDGCFHFACSDPSEKNVKTISKTIAILADIYAVGKESENVELVISANEEKIQRHKLIELIKRVAQAGSDAKIKDLLQTDAKIGGIRFVIPPDVSHVIDVSGISVTIGPRKMTRDKLKDEATIIELIEGSTQRITKTLEAK